MSNEEDWGYDDDLELIDDDWEHYYEEEEESPFPDEYELDDDWEYEDEPF